MPPSIIGTPVSSFQAGPTTSWTQSITVPSGTNTALIVVCNHVGSTTDQSNVAYNGTNMVHIVDIAGATELRGSMWYLANPTATTANIVATTVSQTNFYICAFVLQNCGQNSGTVLDISGTATGGSGTSASKAVTTTVANDFMVTWMGGNPTMTSFVAGGTQSLTATPHTGTGGSFGVSTDTKATAGSYTGSFTWTGSSDFDIYVAGLLSAGGGSSTVLPYRALLGVGI